MRAAFLSFGLILLASPAFATDAAPVELTAEQDHKLMMDQLGITAIRQGANGRDPAAPNYANYDEKKANPWPVLPDPLKLANGSQVKTAGTGGRSVARNWWRYTTGRSTVACRPPFPVSAGR
jgi:hypothetical protein